MWLLIPASVFLLHSVVFWSWTVDDAGISFAYARNLAQGHGLVAQVGQEAVEGYSSPLWVLLCSALYWLDVFSIPITYQLVSVTLVLVAFIALYRAVYFGHRDGHWVALAALTITAMQPAFVAWTNSGLENPLLVALVGTLVLVCVLIANGKDTYILYATGGLIASACALTRPEGILYSVVVPLVVAMRMRRDSLTRQRRLSLVYGLCLLIPISTYLTFRFLYFGSLLPNTYYAKGGPSLLSLLEFITLAPATLEKLLHLFEPCAGYYGATATLISLGAIHVYMHRQRRLSPATNACAVVTAVAAVAFILLPYDSMLEWRFATAFFPTFYLYVFCLAADVTKFRDRQFSGARAVAYLVGLGALTAYLGVPRTIHFSKTPPIPLSEVVAHSEHFELAAEIVGAKTPSVLTADVGGMLLRGKLAVVDLGMLTNRQVAATLGEGAGPIDRASFHDYIFDTAHPTFIRLRAYHSWAAQLDTDPRFRRDYTPIVEYRDRCILTRYGMDVISGDFVRSEYITSPTVLRDLRVLSRQVVYFGCDDCPQ